MSYILTSKSVVLILVLFHFLNRYVSQLLLLILIKPFLVLLLLPLIRLLIVILLLIFIHFLHHHGVKMTQVFTLRQLPRLIPSYPYSCILFEFPLKIRINCALFQTIRHHSIFYKISHVVDKLPYTLDRKLSNDTVKKAVQIWRAEHFHHSFIFMYQRLKQTHCFAEVVIVKKHLHLLFADWYLVLAEIKNGQTLLSICC